MWREKDDLSALKNKNNDLSKTNTKETVHQLSKDGWGQVWKLYLSSVAIGFKSSHGILSFFS